MLPQHFNADFYPNASQFVNPGYSGQFSQNPEQGPSASTSHSPPPQLPPSTDSDPPRKRQRSAVRPRRRRGNSVGDDNADNSPGSGSGSAQGSHRFPKKKKANRACFHCQKAHLTCDDSRPCQRCIKRGLADKCTEGLRKKAKYLLDEEELAALKQQQQQQKSRERPEPDNEPPGLPPPLPPPRQELDPPHNPTEVTDPDPLFNLAFDPTYPFGSEAANLEYSILSAILGNPSPPDESSRLNRHSNTDAQSSSSNVNGSYPQFATPSWPAPPPQGPQQSSPSIQPSFLQQPPNSFPGTPPYRPQIPHAQSYSFEGSPPSQHHTPGAGANTTIHQPQAQVHYSQPTWTEPGSGPPPMTDVSGASGHDTSFLRTNVPSQQQSLSYPTDNQSQDPSPAQSRSQGLAPLSPPPSNSSPGTPLGGEPNFPFQVTGQGQSAQMHQQHLEDQEQQQRIARARASQLHQTAQWSISGRPVASTSASAKSYAGAPAVPGLGGSGIESDRLGSSVYEAVTKRYDYTQGYHDLMRHLHGRFDKNDILRIVRALAIVRPSLIALQMPLTEEDEVFVEKCFQRSLLELDKLISFGGTPTVVWRRTGEICLVGFEFTMLTGWTREELIGKNKYIYELFENQSTVEYYEKFAAHAFENTTQSVISHCVLLKPSGSPVPCAFCFSIRRDIFDLPNIIIGQWLPLL